MRKGLWLLCLLLVAHTSFIEPARAQGEAGSKWPPVLRSALFPGWGQLSQGRYWQGVAFSGLALMSLTGFIVADINYQRSLENLEGALESYNTATSADDALSIFNSFGDLKDEADSRYTWRQFFLFSTITVWTLNLVDVFLVGPKKKEPFLEPDDSSAKLNVTPWQDGWAVSASLRF